MNQREQFGGYLLLKKLAEDPLGETFRAGRVGKQGVERVVLLRVFNGQGVDGSRLWQRLRARAPLQQTLKSPNLGDGIDVGEVRGVPFVAYDYISGKTLAALLEQAERKRRPVPMDHALLVTERIAQALTVAFETRQGDERVLHGFLVPQFVMLSNEGETRVIGLEGSIGLREAAGGPAVREAFARYLAPEALAGDPVGKPDDVYSLGVVLYEMLTNHRLPPPAASGYGPVVDEAILAGEGTPLASEMGALLKKALAPREQRFGDVQAFHRALAKLMFDGAYNPTTFNLAFFMHNLFRDEIERESQEMEAEKLVATSGAAAASATSTQRPNPAAPRFGREQTGVGSVAGASVAPESAPAHVTVRKPSTGPNKGLVYGGIAAALAAVGIGGYFVMSRAPSSPSPEQLAAASPAAPVDASADEAGTLSMPAGDVTTGGDPVPTAEQASADALQAQMALLIEDRFKSGEAALRKQYDDQIKALQRQLEDAKRTERATGPTGSGTGTTAATSTGPAAGVGGGTAPSTTAPAGGASFSEQDEAAGGSAQTTQTLPVPAPAAPTQAPPPAPAAPVVRLGDLVTMGPGVTPPRVDRNSVNPRYPAIARQTGRSAIVVVRVLVDENGRAMEAQLKDNKRIGLGFDDAALDAARRASFTPASKNGVRVKMWYDLSINFQP